MTCSTAYDTIELDDQSRSAIIERVREGKARSQEAPLLPDRDVFSAAVATVVRALARETYPAFCRSEKCAELVLLIAREEAEAAERAERDSQPDVALQGRRGAK